ncbi:small-conductance mechanosensitive channel [Neorhizobium galegae]|uniref:mechanosensitive ion channel family protein n=1 Tax=Neorhizobium galegae TaxID=399 RepID=UPI001AE58BC3|nr:mechanosensitive ion channel family protein [Neorhizobium galegae]MBP2550552.1 small-conductance mechanosensitive channel [Neorhizobium galegae]
MTQPRCLPFACRALAAAAFSLLSLSAPGVPRAAEAVTIVVNPGQNPTDIDAAVKAAGAGGRPVEIRLAAPTSSGVPAETPAAATIPTQPPAPAPPAPTVAASAPAGQPSPAPSQAAPAAASSAAPAATVPAPADARPAPTVTMTEMWVVSDVWEALAKGTQMSAQGVLGLPAAFRSSWATLEADRYGPRDALLYALFAGLCGFAVAAAVTLGLGRLILPHVPAQPFWRASVRLAIDAISISLFLSISHGVLQKAMPRGLFSHQVALAIVATFTGMLIYMAVARFAFKPALAGRSPLININRPNWHFAMMTLYGTLNAFIGNSVRLADVRMLAPEAADSWLFLTSSVLTVVKLWWFIAGRRDIAEVFAGRDASPFRRAVGTALADFYIVSAVLIWVAGLLVAGTAHNAAWARAAGTTQFLIIMIPILDLSIVSLVTARARRREQKYGTGLPSVLLWSLRTPLAGAVWLTGLHLIVELWEPLMMGATTLITSWLVWLEKLSFSLIVSWSLCSFLIKYFEAIAPTTAVILPGTEDEAHEKATSRLTTVLPIVRNLILGAVMAIAALVVISSAGIDVAPLLAGFGVLGLALSFGSQTLVKDVVSGIFFLAEDAFRIGEYIDCGKLMGTVEQISLRSVRLRHHNGPIHTIPFGQIASVTNYSRDWGTTKFELRFDRDADLETIRKTAKKVGIGLLEHPEFGGDFLVPLKMQGIQTVNETSMVIRFKFTARPGKPSLIKREGMKRLLAACREAGLPLASNAVVVRSGTSTVAESGAAATVVPLPVSQAG